MIGARIIHLQAIDSTNNYAAKLLNDGELVNGTVIMADFQTEGRGQRGTQWHSVNNQNLTFSVFVDELNMEIASQFDLSRVVAIVLVDFFKLYDVEAKIKWPNDIYVGKRKIAGVLIENQLKNGRLKSGIIGVGMNINQTKFNDFVATSLSAEKKIDFDIKKCLYNFIGAFNHVFYQLMILDRKSLNEKYKKNLLGYHSEMKYADEDREFFAEIVDVSPEGKLILKTQEEIRYFDLKEVKLIN